MARKMEERMDLVEQELQRLPIIDENLPLLTKSIKEMNAQINKQQQVILKYIEGIIRDNSSAGKTTEGSTSHTKSGDTILSEVVDDSKTNTRHEDINPMDRSKFKKVEMPVFNGTNPDPWLFRADRFFKIHEKLTVVVISFDGSALDWYRSNDELEAFKNWDDLKQRILVRFRTIQDGTLGGKFFSIKQETTVEEYRNIFDKLLAPLAFLQTMVLEETFMNGFSPWLKTEVDTLDTVGFAQMMKLALKIENREMVRRVWAE
ncbi:transposon Tf2-1 polyprotein isoform X1 [Cucumis melo var. makuwa]|uniref:Transposon Tf2-1 polyprotein isoform X1 n=1 Tax=Cucumis melo var. makuwa TaxID=1194695 RepID=A0A5D3CGL5_CUCMM|nr:transposon Tf2-1 polyprotein isoform X1 [Cucumis melo var. makuwa]